MDENKVRNKLKTCLKQNNIPYREMVKDIYFSVLEKEDVRVRFRKDSLRFNLRPSLQERYDKIDKSLYFFSDRAKKIYPGMINPTPFVKTENIEAFILALYAQDFDIKTIDNHTNGDSMSGSPEWFNNEAIKAGEVELKETVDTLREDLSKRFSPEVLSKMNGTELLRIKEEVKIENEINTVNLRGEEKEAFVKIRVNQGVFRDNLVKRYRKCCLCGVSDPRFLRASHIKPWSVCEPGEKLDVDNGFLLCPNHDLLFDGGFISFDDTGKMIVSDEVSTVNRLFLNANQPMVIKLTRGNIKYLEYHREHIFKG